MKGYPKVHCSLPKVAISSGFGSQNLETPNHWLNTEAPDTLRGVLHSNRARIPQTGGPEKLWRWQFDIRNLKAFIKGSLVANFRYTNFWVAGEE